MCTTANDAGTQPDYSGQVVGTSKIRITDNYNGAPATCVDRNTCNTAATVRYPAGTAGDQDVPFATGTQCVPTAATTTIGSNCNFNTTANTIVPDVVVEGKQAVVQLDQIKIWDAGANGVSAGNPLPGAVAACPPSCFPAGDATLFATQGIYIP